MRTILFSIIILFTIISTLVAAQPLQKGSLLIASESITDPRFTRSVILIIQHDTNGTLGLIINKQTNINLKHLFKTIPDDIETEEIYFGGPVGAKRILALLNSPIQPEGGIPLLKDTYLVGLEGAFDRLMRDKKDDNLHIFFGYTGWAPGQLQRELDRGGWQLSTGDATDIFNTPAEDLWDRKQPIPDGRWVVMPTNLQGAKT